MKTSNTAVIFCSLDHPEHTAGSGLSALDDRQYGKASGCIPDAKWNLMCIQEIPCFILDAAIVFLPHNPFFYSKHLETTKYTDALHTEGKIPFTFLRVLLICSSCILGQGAGMGSAQGGLGGVVGRFKGVMEDKQKRKMIILVGGILLVFFILWMSLRK